MLQSFTHPIHGRQVLRSFGRSVRKLSRSAFLATKAAYRSVSNFVRWAYRPVRNFVLWSVFHATVGTLIYFQAWEYGLKNAHIAAYNEEKAAWGRTGEMYASVLAMYAGDGWQWIHGPAPEWSNFPRAGRWGWKMDRMGKLMWDMVPNQNVPTQPQPELELSKSF